MGSCRTCGVLEINHQDMKVRKLAKISENAKNKINNGSVKILKKNE